MTVIAFDVNETLLDLRALDAPFAAAFGDASQRPVWFSIMLQVAFVGGLTGSYTDFTTAQRSALAIVAKRQKVTLSADPLSLRWLRFARLLRSEGPAAPSGKALSRLEGTRR